MNKVTLTGHMTKDCELRYTKSQKAVATFTIAVNDGYGDNQHTSFFNCVVWGTSAENLQKYTGKGSKLLVEGRLQQRSYDNKNGQKVYVIEVICNQIEYLTRKENNQSNVFNEVDKNNFGIKDEDIQF